MAERATAEKLIEVAGEIFGAKGISATVREICAAANCSVAAINYHFGDKEKLYEACLAAAIQRKQQLFPVPSESEVGDGVKNLQVFLRVVTQRMTSAKNLNWHNQLVLREVLEPPMGKMSGPLQRHLKPDFESMRTILAKLLDGVPRQAEAIDLLANEILARCMFLRTGRNLRAILGLDSPVHEDAEQVADAICESILVQINTLRTTAKLKTLKNATNNCSSLAPK